ncbi:hypothetical protein PTI98_009389 [Pleurotus ostreatus]|nr:hypothetical protein PTI98_009389 [Pleurotus ostreatus]
MFPTSHLLSISTMKFSFTTIASIFLATQAAAIPAETAEQPSCPRTRAAVPLYRAYHGATVNHFYTTNQAEWQSTIGLGYQQEGTAGRVYASQEVSTIPLYRLYNPSHVNHFYTTSEAEAVSASKNGYTREGVAAYVFPTQICGSQPLFRLFNAANVDHFYTANWEERNSAIKSGYTDEGVAGYILG